MIQRELTSSVLAVMTSAMQGMSQVMQGSGRRAVCAAVMVMCGAVALSACVSVNAPDKPIVIELNINIKQEVIYRLAADAGNTIDAHPEIF
jgi:YnbE-like lipoprotein